MSVEGGPGPEFLKQKYDLHTSDEVGSAKERTEVRTGEQLPQNPDVLIQNYLDRFKEITDRSDPEKRQRGIEALKKILHHKFVIKPDEIPEGYFENQQRLAREQGHGDIEITPDMRQQLSEVIITDQESTLDNWVDYLTSADAAYPDWLKYFALRSVTQMGGFDKERHAFSKRSTGTTKPFPDLNREALAYVLDAVEKKYQGRNIDSLEGEEKENFQKLLNSENFAKLYAWAIEKVTPASVEQITITEGKWVKYDKGSDATPLVQSLQGHGTGWCTAGESTARTQLDAGDFYVYYSHDQQGQPTIPRVAIRMQGGQIGEVRGIAAEQNLDPYIGDVVQDKLQEFPDGKAYEKKNSNMKQLTEIENKMRSGQELSKAELVFLYEIDQPIEGFGYQRDPRIEELRSQRNATEDAPIVLDCQPEEISRSADQIQENTKSYIGPLFPGIFKLQNIENIYTSFPEGKVRKSELEIGGKTKVELVTELRARGIKISDFAQDMLDNPEFTTQPNPEQLDLVRLKVRDLGFPNGATTDQIYAKAEEYGLELCPAEVGLHQRLKDENQTMYERYRIAMKQISDRDGSPNVFNLLRLDDGLWLSIWAEPDVWWSPGSGLLFRLRNVSQAA